jgi:S1-C subfamily serine protease
VETLAQILAVVESSAIGETVPLELMRGKEVVTVNVTLAEFPAQPAE